ncbi:MAG: hypothetical protein K6T86_19080 [Pirellulales bacterium]|nr:hypothetical protein [Pirellulales bacterium]
MRVLVACLAAWLAGMLCGDAAWAQREGAKWLEGKQLAARLETPVSAAWAGTPLREATRSLSAAQRVSVLVDRRIDPTQPLELRLNEVPLAEALGRMAAAADCGYTQFGPVAYIGPSSVAARLRTLSAVVEEAFAHAPGTVRRLAGQKASLSWPDLAAPRELLAGLAESAGIQLSGLEQVPHDLWAAADLPPLSWMDRVLIVTVQFDLWLQPAGDGTFALLPIPPEVLLERSYAGGSNPAALVQRWKALAPHCQIEIQGKQVVVRGLLEDHELLRGGTRRPARPPRQQAAARPRIKRLHVRGKLGSVLEQIASNYGLALHLDPAALAAAGAPADTLVELEVNELTVEEALHRLLDPLKLGFRLDDAVLHVFPAEEG